MKKLLEAAMTGMLVCASATAIVGQRGETAGSSCDRACLLGIADAYLAALVAHDPARAPMTPNARFTEQAQVLPVGEGLWRTATEGPTTFKIPVPDPVAGQIGLIVMMKEAAPSGPGPERAVQLALRLKVQNRQITEAEHIIARITNPASLANLQTPRPALQPDVANRQLLLQLDRSERP